MITSNSVLFTIICVFALQALILCFLLISKKPSNLSRLFLSLLIFFHAINAINIVVVNVLKDYNLMYVFRYIQLELLYGIGPTLYFYTLAITRNNFKFKTKYWLHFVPLLLEFLFYRTSIYREGSNGLYENPIPDITYVYLTQQWIGVISILVYSVISLVLLKNYTKRLKNYHSKLEDKSFKWLRIPIILYGSYYIFWNVLTEIDRFIFDRSLREYYFLPTFTVIAILSCWLGFKGYVMKDDFYLKYMPDDRNTKNEKEEKDLKFMETFHRLMISQKPYLNAELNLTKLSELLDMNPKTVSQKINQNFEKNFYDLINYYRVEEFKKRLQQEESLKLSLLGLAYECGFNSKSTFNLVFKKNTQLTPSQYLKKVKNESE